MALKDMKIKFSRGINGWKPSQTSLGYYKLYPWGYTLVKIEREKTKINPSGYWYKVRIEKRGSGHSYSLGQYDTMVKAKKAAKSYMRQH